MLPNTTPNPGAYPHDPECANKLEQLAPNSTIIYSASDHSGNIVFVDTELNTTNPKGKKIKIKPSERKRIGLVLGDSIICHRSTLTPITLALRTCDCIPLVIWDKSHFGVVHVSNINLCSYRTENFKGSILKSLFQYLDPKNCHVIVGPSIGGIHYGDCKHYGYTETVQQDDGSHLINQLFKEYPNINISRQKGRGMIYFQWGAIIVGILKSHGVDPRAIQNEYNLCTMCFAEILYSNRAAKVALNREEMTKRYGNITLVRTTA